MKVCKKEGAYVEYYRLDQTALKCVKRVGDGRSLHCETGVYQDGFERTGSGRAGSL